MGERRRCRRAEATVVRGVVRIVENVGDGGWTAVGTVGTVHTGAYIYMLLAARTVPAGGVDEPGCRPPEVGSLRPPEVGSVRWRGRVLSQGGDLRRSPPINLYLYIERADHRRGRRAWTSGGRLEVGARGPLEVGRRSVRMDLWRSARENRFARTSGGRPVNISLARMRHDDIIRGLALKIDWLALFLERPPATSADLHRLLDF